MEDDELAFKLVELYVKDVSKGHEKRRMGLDTILNAYFYALLRINRKTRELTAIESAVEKEEELLKQKSKEYKPIPEQEIPTQTGEFKFD